MKPDLHKTAADCALSFEHGFSHRAPGDRPTGDVLSLTPGFSLVLLCGRTERAPVSLAPGFSRVEPGRGNEKTVSTVFLKRAILSEYQ